MSSLSGLASPLTEVYFSLQRSFTTQNSKSGSFFNAMTVEVVIAAAGALATEISYLPVIGIAANTFSWWAAARTSISMALIALLLPNYHKPQIEPTEPRALSEADRKDRILYSILLNTVHYLMLNGGSKLLALTIPCLSSPVGICLLLATQALFQGFVLAQYGMSRDGFTAKQMVSHACQYPAHLTTLGMLSTAPTWFIDFLLPEWKLLKIAATAANQLWQLKCLTIANEYRLPGVKRPGQSINKAAALTLQMVNPLFWMWSAVIVMREQFRRPPNIVEDATHARHKFDAIHELSINTLLNSLLDAASYLLFFKPKLLLFNGLNKLSHVTTDIANTITLVSESIDAHFDKIRRAKAVLQTETLNLNGRLKQFAQRAFQLTKGQTDAIHFILIAVDTKIVKAYLSAAKNALKDYTTEAKEAEMAYEVVKRDTQSPAPQESSPDSNPRARSSTPTSDGWEDLGTERTPSPKPGATPAQLAALQQAMATEI